MFSAETQPPVADCVFYRRIDVALDRRPHAIAASDNLRDGMSMTGCLLAAEVSFHLL